MSVVEYLIKTAFFVLFFGPLLFERSEGMFSFIRACLDEDYDRKVTIRKYKQFKQRDEASGFSHVMEDYD